MTREGRQRAWRLFVTYGVPSLVFLVAVLLVFWRLWTPISGERRAFNWDAQWEYWGDLQFLHDSVRAGELPLWNPYDRGGYPLHADPQAGVLYPVNWGLVGLAMLTGPVWWLISIKIVFHFWLAGIGMYAFLRRRQLPRAACYAGGFFFIMSYPFSHAMFSALNWGMAWAPWVLLAVDRWAERPTAGRAAAVALALGLAELAGAPAAFWYSLMVIVPYGVWAIAHHARASADARAYLRAAAITTGIAGGLFVAIVAAQMSATSALIAHTVRDTRDMVFIGTTAFTSDDLFGMLVPRMPGEGPYVTIVMAFAIGALLSARPDARSLTLAGAAVLGVLCAWGDVGPFLGSLASLVPPFGFFRRAHRYLYATMLPLAVLGAEGLAMLAREESAELRRRWGRFLLGAGALGVIVFGCGFVTHYHKPNAEEPIRDAFGYAFVVVIVSTWALHQVVVRDGRLRQAFLGIAVVVMCGSLWFARAKIVELNWWPIPKPTRDAEIAMLEGVPLEARIYDREVLQFRPGIRRHIRDLGGYEGDPLALARFGHFLAAAQAQPALLGHANVRWLLEQGATKTKPKVLGKGGLKAVRAGVYELPAVAPAVLWVDAATIVDGGDDKALVALRGGVPGQIAVLERGTLAPAEAEQAARADGGAPTAGRITSYGRSRLTAEIDAPAAGVVVIAEGFYPGWKATVDGAPARIVPANGMFRGVLVEAGHHVIEMRYPATGYRLLMPLCLLGLLGATVLTIREQRRA